VGVSIVINFTLNSELTAIQRHFFDKKIKKFPLNLKFMYIFREYKYLDELSLQLGEKLIID
jgi:hypothetical protein